MDTIQAMGAAAAESQLQWGHGVDAVDSPIAGTVGKTINVLQWGHGVDAVDTALNSNALVTPGAASMGPRR